jgi:two-component system CheB/CheR fusion protein
MCLNPDGVITDWLGASQEVFGFTAEEVLGQTTRKLFTPADLDKGLDRYELEVAAGNSRSEDDRWHVRKDGTRIWASGSVTAINDDQGKLMGFVKIARDRTDLRGQFERVEKQVETLGKSQERTSLFIQTLGHELRNPLGPLSNAIQLLEKQIDDPRHVSILQIMSRQLTALVRLADDLMDVTRFETGKFDLKLQPVDLRRVLSDAVKSVDAAAAHKQVTVQAILPAGPLMVALDEARFQRLILNLLGNAIKYTQPGGLVWVKATQDNSEVLFRVEDNGAGIAPEVLPRIFELFTQEESASTSAPGGLGIGLAVVREIAELHQGTVQARSGGHGKGSEFTVRLPALAPA